VGGVAQGLVPCLNEPRAERCTTLKGRTTCRSYATISPLIAVKPDREHKKPLRLKDFSYQGHHRYFITIRSHGLRHHFTREEVMTKVVELLKDTAKQEGFSVWAYCFMPDHLHLLVEGQNLHADMRKFVTLFKRRTSYWFKSIYGEKLWEPNYYERVLRTEEATVAVARYIFRNPVREGLVEDYGSYPYSGSFELEDICNL